MTTAEGQDSGEIARRTAMLGAIGYAATQIVAAADWRAGMQELLSRLGQATAVSRVTLFEVHPGPDGRLVESCRYDWADEGLATLSDDARYQCMPLSDEDRSGELGDWARRRERGEVVQATLRELRGYAREVFLEHGTLSFASVPIMVAGRFWGFLGFDDCKIERVWHPLEIEVLQTAAALIAGALERARSHEQLRLSEERYKMAARGTNDGLWNWDLAAGTAYLSPRLHELLHLEDGALGSDMEALFRMLDPAHAAALREYLARRFARRKQKFEFECRIPHSERGSLWVILRGLIVYQAGSPCRTVGSLRDITDRMEAQAQLVESEARARAVVETAFDAIVTVDEEGRIVEFNAAASRIFGHSREEVIGRQVSETIIPEHRRSGHLAGMEHFMVTGERRTVGRTVELEGLRADGSLIPIELSVTEVPLAKGRLFTAILRDLTERKEFQRQLGEAERKRANLARYFSPNMVDELMQSGGDLERARTQIVTMLFVDLIGFTTLSAQLSSVKVIELLRECLAFFEEAVFAHQGTLDKYLGDGLMATFGTPRPGPRDATNALACARLMAAKTVAWNAERRGQGLQPLHVGIGLHHGEVVLGDIGGERRLEFAVLGDTVNVARRIEEMTRSLDIAILASDAVIEAVRREGGAAGLAEFQDLGQHVLRGREGLIRLWGCAAERTDGSRLPEILPPGLAADHPDRHGAVPGAGTPAR
ncbi:MAG TPA: PAS domain S-box protein [Dongiaceae bacterium]